MYSLDEVKKVDPEVAQAIIDEENRQNSHIELISSENWVSNAVMSAMGLCQCTAPFRSTGEYGSAVRCAEARRYHYGYESGSRRTSDPWFTRQYVR